MNTRLPASLGKSDDLAALGPQHLVGSVWPSWGAGAALLGFQIPPSHFAISTACCCQETPHGWPPWSSAPPGSFHTSPHGAAAGLRSGRIS